MKKITVARFVDFSVKCGKDRGSGGKFDRFIVQGKAWVETDDGSYKDAEIKKLWDGIKDELEGIIVSSVWFKDGKKLFADEKALIDFINQRASNFRVGGFMSLAVIVEHVERLYDEEEIPGKFANGEPAKTRICTEKRSANIEEIAYIMRERREVKAWLDWVEKKRLEDERAMQEYKRDRGLL